MPVEKYRWLPGNFERLGVNERMHRRRNDFDRLESSRAQIVRHPLRGALDVRLVFALCAHTRYAQKLFQLRKMLLLAAVNEFSKVHIGDEETLSECYTQLVIRMLRRKDILSELEQISAVTVFIIERRLERHKATSSKLPDHCESDTSNMPLD